jgi:hypothetical protein
LEIKLEEDKLTVATQTDGFGQSVQVGVGGTIKEIEAGERHTFDL